MLKKSVLEFWELLKEKRMTTVSGAWVYFFLSSLIPLTFLIITAFAVFGVEISLDMVSRLPEGIRETGEIIVNTAKSAQEGVTIFFGFTVIFSVSALLAQMRKDGNSIYGLQERNSRGIFIRLWGVVALFVFFAILLLSALLVAFGESIFLSLPKSQGTRFLTSFLIGIFITLLSYMVIIFLNKYICPIKVPTSCLLIGSMVSLVIIFFATIIMGVYISIFGTNNAFYGSLAGIVVFLLWAYVIMNGLLIGTVLIFHLNNKKVAVTIKERKRLSAS